MKTKCTNLVSQIYEHCSPLEVKNEREVRESEQERRISNNVGTTTGVLFGAAMGGIISLSNQSPLDWYDYIAGVVIGMLGYYTGSLLTRGIIQNQQRTEGRSFMDNCRWLRIDDERHKREPTIRTNRYRDIEESWKEVDGKYTCK